MSTELVPYSKVPPHVTLIGKDKLAYDVFCPQCGFTLWTTWFGYSTKEAVVGMTTGFSCVICGTYLIVPLE